jgi:putative ABC transport system permease protein
LGIISRAFRNISRRKIRALLVIIALGFSMAIMISIPAGINATQESTQRVTQSLSESITQASATINQTLTQIDCSLASNLEGFGFGNFTPGQFGSGNFRPPADFNPGQFGRGTRPGEFGAGSFSSRGSTPMNESIYSDLSTVQGVAAVAPILDATEGQNETISTPFGSFNRLQVDYIIEGLPLTSNLVDNYPILPTNITAGRNLQAGDSGVVLLSENNSAYFGVGVGGTMNILGRTFQVIGIHGTTGVSDRQVLYMNLSDTQAITNNAGMITSIKVFAENVNDVTTISDAIQASHSELSVTTAQDRLDAIQQTQTFTQQQLENAQNTLSQTQTTALTEIIIAVSATSLIVLFVMLYTVRERTKEIGTLKAIGFSNLTVMSQFMLEGVLLSVVAGVLGVAIGVVAAPTLVSLLQLTPIASGRFIGGSGAIGSAVTITPELILIAFGAAVLLGALGSLYPAWRAARTRPAEAMRYE